MTKLEIQRDHTGRLHAVVGGAPLAGAIVKDVTSFTDVGMAVTIIVPMRDVTIGEVTNVVPLVRPQR